MENFDLSLFLTYISIAIPFNITLAISANSIYSSTFKRKILPYLRSSPEFTSINKINKLRKDLDTTDIYLDNLIKKSPSNKKLLNQIKKIKYESEILKAKYEALTDIACIHSKLKPKYASVMFFTSFVFCMAFMILTMLKSFSPKFNMSMLIYIINITHLYFTLLILDDCFGEAIRDELKYEREKLKSKRIFSLLNNINITFSAYYSMPIILYIAGIYHIYEYNINLEKTTNELQLAMSIITLPYLGQAYYFAKINSTLTLKDMSFLISYTLFKSRIIIIRILIYSKSIRS